MGALFKGEDLEPWFLAARLRSGAHPGGVAADDDQSFFGHISGSSSGKKKIKLGRG